MLPSFQRAVDFKWFDTAMQGSGKLKNGKFYFWICAIPRGFPSPPHRALEWGDEGQFRFWPYSSLFSIYKGGRSVRKITYFFTKWNLNFQNAHLSHTRIRIHIRMRMLGAKIFVQNKDFCVKIFRMCKFHVVICANGAFPREERSSWESFASALLSPLGSILSLKR